MKRRIMTLWIGVAIFLGWQASSFACYDAETPEGSTFCSQCANRIAADGCIPSFMSACCETTCGYPSSVFQCSAVPTPTPVPTPPPPIDCNPPSFSDSCSPSTCYIATWTGSEYAFGSQGQFLCTDSSGTCNAQCDNNSPAGSSFDRYCRINPTGPCGEGGTTSTTTTPPSTPPPSTPPPSTPPPSSGTPAATPVPTPTPHIHCPSGSTDDPGAYNNCFCTVKGQIFSWNGGTSGSCACPGGYEVVIVDQSTSRAECRPVVRPEFFRSSDALSDNYPVCGKGRAPTDGMHVVLKGAASTVPNSNEEVMGPNGYVFKYATGSGTAPQYLYQNYDHCACTWQDFPASPTKYSGTASSTVAGSKPRFYPDDLETIGGQNNNADQLYGAVTIAKSDSVDGRLGVVYAKGYSQCGCPNLNEEMQPIDSTDPYASGVVCRPALTDPYRVLMDYDPLMHDFTPALTQVINRDKEVVYADGHVIRKVMLRKSASDWTPQPYKRKIWTCMYPFTLDIDTRECKFDPIKNACNQGNNEEIPPSEVSLNVTGPTKDVQFMNTINKKLACCLNSFGATGIVPVKFDCAENKVSAYTDFNALWSSADSPEQGGQLNAMVLTNPQGRWLSGFYTLDGARCEEFSEFSGTIQPGIVNPLEGVSAQMNRAQGKSDPNAFEPKGSAIPLPGSGVGSGGEAYSYMLGKMIGLGKTVPSTASERRRCPILVRGAMSAECPPTGGTPLATYQNRCATAKNIYIHIRAEQVWEIAGQAKMRTVDTLIDDKRMSAGDISIDRIISRKYGNVCPPGQVADPAGGGCHY